MYVLIKFCTDRCNLEMCNGELRKHWTISRIRIDGIVNSTPQGQLGCIGWFAIQPSENGRFNQCGRGHCWMHGGIATKYQHDQSRKRIGSVNLHTTFTIPAWRNATTFDIFSHLINHQNLSHSKFVTFLYIGTYFTNYNNYLIKFLKHTLKINPIDQYQWSGFTRQCESRPWCMCERQGRIGTYA